MGFFTAILEPFMLRRPFDFTEVLLGLLAIAGISIVFHFDPHYKLGIIISLFSALLASIFPITEQADFAKNGCGNSHPLSAKWRIFIYHPVDARLPVLFSGGSPAAFFVRLGLAYRIGVLCTVIAYDLFMKALQKIPAFTVNLSYNLEPIYGVAMAFLIYREDKEVSPGFYYGFFLIIAAVVLQTLRYENLGIPINTRVKNN